MEYDLNVGNGDQQNPGGNGPKRNNSSDGKKSNNNASQRPHHIAQDWREFRATLFAREQVRKNFRLPSVMFVALVLVVT